METKSGVWWCTNCQIPLLTPICEACGFEAGKPLAKDLVPVFSEEIILLRERLGFEHLPKDAGDFYLWNSGTSYFQAGRKVAHVSLRGGQSPHVRMDVHELLSPDSDSLGPVQERLYRANKTHIDATAQEAMSFVVETVATFKNCNVMVAFSGGKDSTCVSDIVRRSLGFSSVLHVIADTTLELNDTYTYIEHFRDTHPQVPLLSVRPSVEFEDLCSLIGPPSRILRWCCTSHKATPMASVVAGLRHNSAGVLTFDGIRASESTRRRGYDRITHKHKIEGEILASPLRHWKDIDVWAWLVTQDLDFNTAYRKGFRRIGCTRCPFNSKWSDFLASEFDPEGYGRWHIFLEDHAKSAGHPDPGMFAASGWRKRAGGRGLRNELARLEVAECEIEPNTYTYTLARPWSDSLLEFLKPFGRFCLSQDDGVVLRGEIVEPHSGRLLASIKVVRPTDSIRIAFMIGKGQRLFRQRLERQMKKYQSCVQCGSCSAYCTRGAIHVNGNIVIDEARCVNCLKCVSADCIAVESLTRKGESRRLAACNGTD